MSNVMNMDGNERWASDYREALSKVRIEAQTSHSSSLRLAKTTRWYYLNSLSQNENPEQCFVLKECLLELMDLHLSLNDETLTDKLSEILMNDSSLYARIVANDILTALLVANSETREEREKDVADKLSVFASSPTDPEIEKLFQVARSKSHFLEREASIDKIADMISKKPKLANVYIIGTLRKLLTSDSSEFVLVSALKALRKIYKVRPDLIEKRAADQILKLALLPERGLVEMNACDTLKTIVDAKGYLIDEKAVGMALKTLKTADSFISRETAAKVLLNLLENRNEWISPEILDRIIPIFKRRDYRNNSDDFVRSALKPLVVFYVEKAPDMFTQSHFDDLVETALLDEWSSFRLAAYKTVVKLIEFDPYLASNETIKKLQNYSRNSVDQECRKTASELSQKIIEQKGAKQVSPVRPNRAVLHDKKTGVVQKAKNAVRRAKDLISLHL